MSATNENNSSSIESKRLSGDPEALVEARAMTYAVKPDQLKNLSLTELQEKMRIWRQAVTLLIGCFKKEANGEKALPYLDEALQIIFDYFFDDYAWDVAQATMHDAQNTEYWMAPEMLRDTAKMLVNLASITGNVELLHIAVGFLENALEISSKNSSVWALAQLELFSIRRLSGDPVDFTEVTAAFEQIVKKSKTAGGADRAAAASWLYVKESFFAGKISAALHGISSLRESAKDVPIPWLNYPVKEMMNALLARLRRITLSKSEK